MCGIVGYIGKQKDPYLGIEALKRLEYRGYDSAGIAVLSGKDVFLLKSAGRIDLLKDKLKGHPEVEGSPFILHTRWATHGKVSEENAHPHYDCKKEIFLVHNGIIENYKELKERLLEKGHSFHSETDSEVLCHLIEDFFEDRVEEAVREALGLVKGTYGLAVISKRDPLKIVVARNASPLLIGVAADGNFVASDAIAFVKHTKKLIYLEDGEVGVLTSDDFSIKSLDNHILSKQISTIDWNIEDAQKIGFPHFMQKEIFEAPEVIKNAVRGRLIEEEGLVKLGGLEAIKDRVDKIKRLIITSCGTSYFAGIIGKQMIEELAGIQTQVELASELRYGSPVLDENTAVLALSQSGETADTLAALRELKRKGVLSLGVVNVVGSSIARETDAGVYNHAGPEIGVASTKNFVSQLVILALFSLFLGRQRGMTASKGQEIIGEIKKLPALSESCLADNKGYLEKLAEKYSKFRNFFFLGRKYNFPIALEGALKLKEISYIHAEGYGAGEMKHGPIALIDENFPTVAIVPKDSVYQKMVSNIEEIRARNGKVIAVATKGDSNIAEIVDDVIYIPRTLEFLTPILTVLPLQLFAYDIGVILGRDVDKPRNLAKSVTVE